MQTNKKALSPIVATILLVVVAVILVTITLSWGKGFTNKGLEGSNTILKETTNNYMIGSPKLNAQGVLSFKNISPGDKSITITGYKIISSSDENNFNSILDIEDTTISPGGTHIISIPAFPPEQKVTIQLITDENEYISVGSINNIPEEQQDIPVPEPEPQQYTAGPFSPGTMADDASIGTIAWTTPNNAVSSNDSYAVYNAESMYGRTSHYLKATNFGFNIPTGATIDGILVEVERKEDANYQSGEYTCRDTSIKIVKADGILGSTNKSTGAQWSPTENYVSYGDLSDLWDETWTAENINDSDFGFVMSLYSSGEGEIFIHASVDHIRMTVYYTI